LPQGEELQRALAGENGDESDVYFEEEIVLLCALVVCLHHHGHHVEADEHHDEDVKELLTDQVKHHSLDQVLKGRREEGVEEQKQKSKMVIWPVTSPCPTCRAEGSLL